MRSVPAESGMLPPSAVLFGFGFLVRSVSITHYVDASVEPSGRAKHA